LEAILQEYGSTVGYLVLLLGSFVEGESFVLTAGFLSYTGFLSLPVCIMIAFLGSMCADQLLFFVGRYYGPSLLDKRPVWKEKSKRVFELLHKYNVWFIVGFRFVYGIRTISPLVIGASGIGVKRFAILNFIAAFFWAVISCFLGYLLGYFFADAIDYMIEKVIEFQKIAFIVLAGIIGFLVVWHRVRKKKT